MLCYRCLLWVLVLIVFLFYGFPRDSRAQEDSILPAFPLEIGVYWEFQGSVKWTVGMEVKEEFVTWRMGSFPADVGHNSIQADKMVLKLHNSPNCQTVDAT